MRSLHWGQDLVTERVRGIPFRVYSERPRHIGNVLELGEQWGSRAHLVQGDTALTFDGLRGAVAAKAAELTAGGVEPGDRILLVGFNSPTWVVNFWACVMAGAVPVLGNAWWSPTEHADAVGELGLRLTLADTRGARALSEGEPTAPWQADLQAPAPAGPVQPRGEGDEDVPAVIGFTSGTSGRPKAVVLSHRAILAGLHQLLHITRRLPHMTEDSTGEAALHTGPMFHIGGVQTLVRAVTVGDTLLMPEGRFDPGEALRLIEEWGVARWSAVPTMVSRVIEHPDVHTRALSTLRSLTVGGAPVTGDFIARLRAGLPGVDPRVATGYGLTENGGQATAASGRDTTQKPGSCGRPLPCVELRIADGAGAADGELLVRSPTQMIGYFGDDESPIDDEGWLHTGDLAAIDVDGHLWITGRAKDMVIRGGENIAPAAVEGALGGLPEVVESAVFGVPHPTLGEEVMAVVTVEEGTTTEHLELQLKGRLASFAIPSRWQLTQETLPTNHSGKIDKSAVKAAALEGSATAGGSHV